MNIEFDSEDSPAAGFYKNGLKDGEWVTRDGVESYTYTEGILNGPFYDYLLESYKNDDCLWQVGNYKDGLRHGEWVTFEQYPKEDCGKIKDTYLYEMGELIDLTIQK